jgi:ComF family protein
LARGDSLAALASLFAEGAQRAVDWALPPRCLTCDATAAEHGAQCAACFRGLGPLRPPFCDRCGVPLIHAGQAEGSRDVPLCPRCAVEPPDFREARAAYWYDDAAKRLIMPLKYRDRPDLARFLALRMLFAGRDLLARADLVVPVPLHRVRLLTRRYNQSAELARALARLARRRCLPDALERRRATPSLAELGRLERQAIVAGAITVRAGAAAAIPGRTVVLVDDVLTSGATASACARALLDAGAAAVDVLAVARVPDRRWSNA